MYKQPYYPPIEESEYEGINEDWRYAYSFFLALLLGSFALAFILIGQNDWSNHGFKEKTETVAVRPPSASGTTLDIKGPVSLNPFLPSLALLRDMKGTQSHPTAKTRTIRTRSLRPAAPQPKVTEPEKDIIIPEPALTGKF
jgi:hypothetical protein